MKLSLMGMTVGLVCMLWYALPAQETSTSPNFKLTQQQVSATFTLPPIVAKVNGVEISINQFWKRLLGISGNAVLTALVDEVLIEQEADKVLLSKEKSKKGKLKSKQSSTAKELEAEVDKRLTAFRKQFQDEQTFQQQLKNSGVQVDDIKKQIRIDLYKERLLGDKLKVAQDEIKKYFDENRQKLATPEQVHLKHILTMTEQEAKDLVLSLNAGANFDLLAKEKSLDTATKDRGGDLGFFSKGMLIPEIQEKAFSLQSGGIDIVKTAMGFHVIIVVEKKPAKEATWDKETQNFIEQILKQAKFNQEYPKFIQSLRSKADIQVLLNQ